MVDVIADIGGTHARFALWDGREDIAISIRLQAVQTFLTRDFASLAQAATAYCDGQQITPERLCLAVAGPVETDRIIMSNNDWSFSKTALKQTLLLDSLCVINDFTAQALLPPMLGKGEKQLIKSGQAMDATPYAILGPGTGLGVCALLPVSGNGQEDISWRPLESEGGNSLFAPRDSQEAELREFIAEKTGRIVTFEEVLSGRGLEIIYRFCAADKKSLSAAEITENAPHDPIAEQAVLLFINCLSNFVLNVILMTGARQGVYLSGGILPHLSGFFTKSAFMHRLSDYGIFSDYLNSVPVWLITAAHPGLLGAGLALSSQHLRHRQI